MLVFFFPCFLWKISAQDIEQNLEFIGEVRDAVSGGLALATPGHVPGQEKEALGRDVGGCGAAHYCSCLSGKKKRDIYIHLLSPCVFFRLFCVESSFSTFPPYFFGLWRLKVFVNQKKAVDVLSKWPPKDRGTSFVNPRSLDVDFSSSQVLRQQRLSRVLHPRWKEPGQGPPGQHSGPILMDTNWDLG